MADDFGCSPPPFQPEAALQALKRDLRGLGLAERAGHFERRGSLIACVTQDGTVIQAARVKRPARSSPEWLHKVLRSSADVRAFCADLKKQLALWSDSDD